MKIKYTGILLCFFAVLLAFGLNACVSGGSTFRAVKQNVYSMPSAGEDVIGESFSVAAQEGDSLALIAMRYDVGILEMRDANPHLYHHKLQPGEMVNIPKQYILPPPQYRHNIIINIAELRLYYFAEDGYTVMTFPIALGKAGWRTPLAKTYIARKQDAPDWNVPKSIQAHALATKGKVLPDVVPPGPENPLGDYALYLGLNGYLIHGNNNPYSIGNLVSSGCIRLHNDDVDKLFWQVSVGTPVRIIYYPVKAGWLNDQLYLESHREISHEQGVYAASTLPVSMIIHNALSGKIADINWHVVSMVTSQRTGIPRVIGSEW